MSRLTDGWVIGVMVSDVTPHDTSACARSSGYSSLFIVRPTAFRFDKKYHEREMFMEAMKFVNLQSDKNVFDRGYWKREIANYLLENGHDFVFRMNKINNKLIPLKTGETNDFIGTFEIGTGKDVRSIKVLFESGHYKCQTG